MPYQRLVAILKFSFLSLGLCAQAYGQIPSKTPGRIALPAAAADAAVGSQSKAPVPPPEVAAVEPLPTAEQIARLTDAQLTDLSVHWQRLAPQQRRALLKTVRARMVNQTDRLREARTRTIELQAQRRFGRVVRKTDEQVSIETRVVQRRSDGSATVSTRKLTFGAGFEQRRSRSSSEQPVTGSGTGPLAVEAPAATDPEATRTHDRAAPLSPRALRSPQEPLRHRQADPLPPTSKVRAAVGIDHPGR